MPEFELSAAWDFGCSKAVKRQSRQLAQSSGLRIGAFDDKADFGNPGLLTAKRTYVLLQMMRL